MPTYLHLFQPVYGSLMSCNESHVTRFFVLLTLAFLASCGGGSTVTGASVTLPSGKNVMAVSVDAGPTGNEVNRLYADVTICQPGSSGICQTIDHVLVDTGSTGLRLLASELNPSLLLKGVAAANGSQLLNCVQFLDNSFAWGPVVLADVVLGGVSAPSLPIQVIGDNKYAQFSSACSSGQSSDSIQALGAKGVLGVGSFKEDCGPGCASIRFNGFYYACANSTCSNIVSTTVPLVHQLKNPIAALPEDNNGFVIDLPLVAASGVSRLDGLMVFGIGTKSNNQATNVTPLQLDSDFFVTTSTNQKFFPHSFIDTGSNGLYFDDASIAICKGTNASGFYCPASTITQIATLSSVNGRNANFPFTVSHALQSFENTGAAALAHLSGPIGDPYMFDWGLPFFFGRRVFVGIEGQPSSLGEGPYYAF